MAKSTPPRPDELELSLFGAGIGECLVVHLGGGDWMVVDSCLNASGERAVSLDYLNDLNVDVARQVRLVLVTHWHDDHIRGISQVVRHSSSAHFACSAALQCTEFFTLVVANEEIKLVEHTSSVSEFSDVLEILQSRSGSRFAVGPDHWACHEMVLCSGPHPFEVEVHALSPSAQTITDTKGNLGKLIPRIGDAIRRFPAFGPNDLSVTLLVKTTGSNLLLGADLENGSDQRRGWRAILASQSRAHVQSDTYKVAHHGSPGADLEAIWTTLLRKDPVAVLTPYARGRKPLPAPEDVQRLKLRTKRAYCTSYPPTSRPPRRGGVDRTMSEVARARYATRRQPGQIRLRVPITGRLEEVTVELFDGAKHL